MVESEEDLFHPSSALFSLSEIVWLWIGYLFPQCKNCLATHNKVKISLYVNGTGVNRIGVAPSSNTELAHDSYCRFNGAISGVILSTKWPCRDWLLVCRRCHAPALSFPFSLVNSPVSVLGPAPRRQLQPMGLPGKVSV